MNFFEDLFLISDDLKNFENKKDKLKEEIMKINQKLPACIYVPFLKSTYISQFRIFEVLQHSEHFAQLIEDFLYKAACTLLYLSRSVLSGGIIEWGESKELLEKNRKTIVLKSNYSKIS